VEAEIKSEFPEIKVTFEECGFGTFKVLLNSKIIFHKWPIVGSFPREGEITDKIRNTINSLKT
jgi:hypothetical protein